MKALFAAVVALAALAAAPAALADPPLHTVFTAGGSEAPMNCANGVVLTETFTFTADRTIIVEDGVRVKLIERAFYDGVITNEATETQFRDRNHYTRIVDLRAGTVTYNGAIVQVHELGGGPVLALDVGHVVYDRATGDVGRLVCDAAALQHVAARQVGLRGVLLRGARVALSRSPLGASGPHVSPPPAPVPAASPPELVIQNCPRRGCPGSTL